MAIPELTMSRYHPVLGVVAHTDSRHTTEKTQSCIFYHSLSAYGKHSGSAHKMGMCALSQALHTSCSLQTRVSTSNSLSYPSICQSPTWPLSIAHPFPWCLRKAKPCLALGILKGVKENNDSVNTILVTASFLHVSRAGK